MSAAAAAAAAATAAAAAGAAVMQRRLRDGDDDDDDDSGSATPVWLQVFSIFSFILVALVGAALPLYWRRIRQSSIALPCLTTFAGGIFLALALVHLLPDAVSDLDDRMSTQYPVAFTIAVVGYALLLYIEKVHFDTHSVIGHSHSHTPAAVHQKGGGAGGNTRFNFGSSPLPQSPLPPSSRSYVSYGAVSFSYDQEDPSAGAAIAGGGAATGDKSPLLDGADSSSYHQQTTTSRPLMSPCAVCSTDHPSDEPHQFPVAATVATTTETATATDNCTDSHSHSHEDDGTRTEEEMAAMATITVTTTTRNTDTRWPVQRFCCWSRCLCTPSSRALRLASRVAPTASWSSLSASRCTNGPKACVYFFAFASCSYSKNKTAVALTSAFLKNHGNTRKTRMFLGGFSLASPTASPSAWPWLRLAATTR